MTQSFLPLVAVLRSNIQALQLCRARVMAASPTCAFSSSSVRVSLRGGEEEEEAKVKVGEEPLATGDVGLLSSRPEGRCPRCWATERDKAWNCTRGKKPRCEEMQTLSPSTCGRDKSGSSIAMHARSGSQARRSTQAQATHLRKRQLRNSWGRYAFIKPAASESRIRQRQLPVQNMCTSMFLEPATHCCRP